MTGERDVPEAASCRPWSPAMGGKGPTSAVSGAMEGEANVAEGICRFPASRILFNFSAYTCRIAMFMGIHRGGVYFR